MRVYQINVTKSQYFLSVLKNKPLNLIDSFGITLPNYSVDYQLLCDRYHSTRRLTSLHPNKVIDLPNIHLNFN